MSEHVNAVEATDEADSSAPPGKRARFNGQPENASAEDLRAWVEGAVHNELDRVIVMTVEDKLCDSVLSQGDQKNIEMLSLVAGPYFDTNILIEDKPVWKSTQIPESHDKHMLIFAHEEGWYISDALFFGAKEQNALKPMIAAWGESDGSDIPRKMHFPFWAKKACEDIRAWGLYDHSFVKGDERDELVGQLQARIAELEGGEAASGSDAKGTGTGKEGRHGWLPRVARLVAAIAQKDLSYMDKLCGQFRSSSTTLDFLVEEKLGNAGKGKGKGESKGK